MIPFNPIPQLEVLVAHDVRFVILGGIAGAAHGSPSITKDLDICYDRKPDNLERLAAALIEMEAVPRGVDDEVPFLLDAKTLAKGDCFTFATKYGPFDILGTPSGSLGYDDLRSRAKLTDLGGLHVWIVSLDDLMRMKRAAGRAKDRIELEVLGGLRDELEGRPER